MSLLLLFWPDQAPPPAPSVINMNLVLNDMYAALNATGAQDLVFWTPTEIFGYFDEGLKRLARNMALFVVYDQSLKTVALQGNYDLPDAQVSTVQCDLNGFILRARNVQQLEALDSQWPTTTGEPKSFLQDVRGTGTLTLYPRPNTANANKFIGLVMHVEPPDLTNGGFLIAPNILQEYFTFYALGEARNAETKGQMQDSSKFFKGLVDLLNQTFEAMWGNAGAGGAR